MSLADAGASVKEVQRARALAGPDDAGAVCEGSTGGTEPCGEV